MFDSDNENLIESAANLVAAALQPCSVEEGAKPFVVVPRGFDVHDLEGSLTAPLRKKGRPKLHDLDSFIAYVLRHKSEQATTLWHTVEPPRFVAVLNDHMPEANSDGHSGPGWADYVASYDCPLSPEWKAWTDANKRQMSQADFAQFIEDNLPDVVEPAGASMLEISRTLSAKKAVNFKAGLRLDNGENQLTYEETIEGNAGAKGQFKVPEVIVLGLPVFQGGARYAVNARLRYRIGDQGKLTMWFDLERPHKIIEDAVAQLAKAVTEKTGLPLFTGER